jgi:hypothetical protein
MIAGRLFINSIAFDTIETIEESFSHSVFIQFANSIAFDIIVIIEEPNGPSVS